SKLSVGVGLPTPPLKSGRICAVERMETVQPWAAPAVAPGSSKPLFWRAIRRDHGTLWRISGVLSARPSAEARPCPRASLLLGSTRSRSGMTRVHVPGDLSAPVRIREIRCTLDVATSYDARHDVLGLGVVLRAPGRRAGLVVEEHAEAWA